MRLLVIITREWILPKSSHRFTLQLSNEASSAFIIRKHSVKSNIQEEERTILVLELLKGTQPCTHCRFFARQNPTRLCTVASGVECVIREVDVMCSASLSRDATLVPPSVQNQSLAINLFWWIKWCSVLYHHASSGKGIVMFLVQFYPSTSCILCFDSMG